MSPRLSIIKNTDDAKNEAVEEEIANIPMVGGGGKGVPRVLGGGGGRGEKERGEEGSGTDFTIEFLEENLDHVF